MTALEQLAKLLREYTGDGSLRVESGSVIATDLGLDSYDFASLLGEAEERFGVEISDRAVMELLTVGDVADYIESHRKN